MATVAVAGVAPFSLTPATTHLTNKQRCRFPSQTRALERTFAPGLRTAASPKVSPLTIDDDRELSGNNRPPPLVEKPKAVFDDTVVEPRGVIHFVEQAKEMLQEVARDGGPPRWFTPLECDGRERLAGAPTLLYLPGIDGVGLGLIRHHQRLKRIFDVWCLHIPVMDRTPFQGMVEYVELSLRSQNAHLQNRPIYIVGESFGACLGLAVAARNPDIDFVLILANPATSFCKSNLQSILSFSDIIPEALYSTMASFQSLAGNSIRTIIPFYDAELQNPLTTGPDNVAVMFFYLSFLADVLPQKSLVWRLQMLKSASLYVNSRLHAIRSQTLIMASVKDQLFPNREEAERISSLLQNCRIRIFNESDHMILLERGIDLVTVIKGAGYYRRSSQTNLVSDFLPPTRREFHDIIEKNRWVYTAASPVMLSTLESGEIVKGLAGIPTDGPAIVVGYHMFLGLELAPLVTEFLCQRNILLRGIAHPFMFQKKSELVMPNTSDFDYIRLMGAVPVSAVNLYKLLSDKSFVLLYPGGVREALHRKGEQYKLFWPEQSEMVRMAAKFGATIIPFGAVGEDDLFELLLDYEDLAKLPFYNELVVERANKGTERLRTNSTGEVANQDLYLPAAVPKVPGRFYFLFGKPIETKGMKMKIGDRKKANDLYLHVKSEVENCLDYLKTKREQDPYRSILARLIYQANNGFKSEVPTFDL